MIEGNETILKIEDLEIEIVENNTVINYGTFNIYQGDFLIIKGKNGSGKSTFLKLFKHRGIPNSKKNISIHNNSYNRDDYYKVLSGKITYNDLSNESIFDYNIEKQSKLNRKIVDIGQEEKFESWVSAYQAMYNPCARAIKYDADLSKEEKNELIAELKNTINELINGDLCKNFKCKPKDFKRKKVTDWSGGQQKMIHILSGIIKAKIMKCKLILMDEPLNNLDGNNKKWLSDIIKDLRESNKQIALLIITHCNVIEGINKVMDIQYNDSKSKNIAIIKEQKVTPFIECIENFR